jgi:O-methyltransferase
VDNKRRFATFPFGVFRQQGFPGDVGELIEAVKPISMFPPYPWGNWLYARVFRERCAGLAGDIVEAGVGMGGMSVFLALLAKRDGLDKQVVSVDSFRGLPPPDPHKDNPYFTAAQYGPASGGEEDLLKSFWLATALQGVADRVEPVQGFFEDVLPALEPERRFCFLHIDADLFGSVTCALEHLYDRVVEGGIVAIDDFFHPAQGPHQAAAEFFNARRFSPLYHVVFPYSVFLIKSEEASTAARSVDGNAYSLESLRRDDFFLQALEESLERSREEPRARANCALLLEVLRREPRYSDAYDYWRALEEFWEWCDYSHTLGLHGA